MNVGEVISRLKQRQCTCQTCLDIRGLVTAAPNLVKAGTHDSTREWPAPNVTMIPRKVGP